MFAKGRIMAILPQSDPGRARTVDLEIRSHMLYPAELRGQTKFSIVIGLHSTRGFDYLCNAQEED